MWLYNRDKTLSEIEKAYYTSVRNCAIEAAAAAFEADALSDDERMELLVAAKDGDHGAKLIELFDVGHQRTEAIEEYITSDADSSVTYTADAALIMLMSSNSDAYQEVDPDGTEEFRAAMAYAADVREMLANEYTMADAARALLIPWTKHYGSPPASTQSIVVEETAHFGRLHYSIRPISDGKGHGYAIGGSLVEDVRGEGTLEAAKTKAFEHALENARAIWIFVTYDVWGNAEDGYNVNDSHRAGSFEVGIGEDPINAAIDAGYIEPRDQWATNEIGVSDLSDDEVIYFERDSDARPMFEIRVETPIVGGVR